jgi:hypothetical protein
MKPLADAVRLPVLCPSSQPELPGSIVFGIVGGAASNPRVAYLAEPVATSGELLELVEPAEPPEVFRFAAACARGACAHYSRGVCRLAQRISRSLPVVVDSLPPCEIRASCRWWRQEGAAACKRCPQIVTTSYAESPQIRSIAFGVDRDGELPPEFWPAPLSTE